MDNCNLSVAIRALLAKLLVFSFTLDYRSNYVNISKMDAVPLIMSNSTVHYKFSLFL